MEDGDSRLDGPLLEVMKTGCCVSRKTELLPKLTDQDWQVLEVLVSGDFLEQFGEYPELLLTWSSTLITAAPK